MMTVLCEDKIVQAIKEVGSASAVDEVCKRLGVNRTELIAWLKRQQGAGSFTGEKLRILEEELAGLHQILQQKQRGIGEKTERIRQMTADPSAH